MSCLLALLFAGSAQSLAHSQPSAAQAVTEEAATTTPIVSVSATPSATKTTESVPIKELGTDLSVDTVNTSFQLPAVQHPWARFQPGAWRELRIVSETFDDMDQVVSRSITTQKEVLQAVAEGKYVLSVQATVELGGKQIVGERKTRILHLETDGAGALVDSVRLEDQLVPLPGRVATCQVWEVRYHDGSRDLTDRIFYDAQRFPFVLKRETFANTSLNDRGVTNADLVTDAPAGDIPNEKATPNRITDEIEQLTEVTAPSVSYPIGDQLLNCSCLRTIRFRTKGDALRVTFVSPTVPGGEVAILSTDFDTEGQRVRSSVAIIVGHGEAPLESETASSATASGNGQP